jgi:hypothetical protein
MKRFMNKGFSFRKNQEGSLSVEAVFAFPMLLLAATATFTFFDVYKAQNASIRANYTISDMLSRETNSIGTTYLNGMYKVFRYIADTPEDGSWIRISQVQCIDDCVSDENRELELEWSHATSESIALTEADFAIYNQIIPLLAESDRLILVETSLHYTPPFARSLVSFSERELVTNVVTRPRFAPQLIWDDTGYDPDSGGDHDDGEDNGDV